MLSAKHLVIITPGFPENEDDSQCIPPLQIFLQHLILSKPELTISVITLQYPGKEADYKWHGIPVYSCGGNNGRLITKLITWKKSITIFKKIYEQRSVDLVHSFWLTEAAMLGNYLGKKFKVPHMVTLMGQDAKPDNNYLKFLDLKFPKLVALSEFHRGMFEKTTGRKISDIIPWGIDEQESHAIPLTERDIDVIGVGSLILVKDYNTFIEVAHLLSLKYPNLRVTLVGDGPERKKLQKQAEQLKLKVQFTGNIQRTEVLQLLKRSKILLHTSMYESQGFVFNEALMAGCKIVSRAVGMAHPDWYWKLGETVNQLKVATEELLNSETKNAGIIPYKAGETASAYLLIYDSVLIKK